MKTTLLTIAAAVSMLTSSVALAHEPCNDNFGAPPSGQVIQSGYDAMPVNHIVTPVMPMAPRDRYGKYVLQSRQVFMPGHFENRNIQRCVGRWNRRCFTEVTRVWVPGYYQTVNEWVWVDFPRHHRHDRYYGMNAPGFGVNVDPITGVSFNAQF